MKRHHPVPKSPSPLHFVCREEDFTKQKHITRNIDRMWKTTPSVASATAPPNSGEHFLQVFYSSVRFFYSNKVHNYVSKFVGLSFFTLLLCILSVKAQDLASAGVAYENGDYETAIILYESALAVGEVSGEIHYNLGNAYYLNREIGKAMQHYLQAERYLPRHTAVASQLAIVRTERIDGDLSEIDPIIIAHNFSADYLTFTELAILAFTVWLLFFLVLAIGMRRKGWAIIIAIFGLVMLMTVGLLGIRAYVETQYPVAVVLSDSVEVMSGPGASYLTLFSLYEGIEFRVLEERDGWLRFVLSDGRQGWVDRTVVSAEF